MNYYGYYSYSKDTERLGEVRHLGSNGVWIEHQTFWPKKQSSLSLNYTASSPKYQELNCDWESEKQKRERRAWPRENPKQQS